MPRLDQALVERGLCDSREKARRAVMAGTVRVNGQTARKPSDTVRSQDEVLLDAPEKFVSRGGHKLEHALNHFHLEVAGLTAIDLGASTGGFTDCLLQRGAAKVFAVDVGHGQLAWKLRQDPRVVVMEKTNARELTPAAIFSEAPASGPARPGESLRHAGPEAGAPKAVRTPIRLADLVTIDCSFISLRKILPPAVALLRGSGKVVALVKPQFEAGKAEADRGAGVITDPAIHQRVLNELEEFVQSSEFGDQGSELKKPEPGTPGPKLTWLGVTESPLLGPAGNKEFLVLLEKSA